MGWLAVIETAIRVTERIFRRRPPEAFDNDEERRRVGGARKLDEALVIAFELFKQIDDAFLGDRFSTEAEAAIRQIMMGTITLKNELYGHDWIDKEEVKKSS